MDNNTLSIISAYPKDKYNLLVPIETVAEISAVHKPVMNVVSISTNLADKEIYEQQKGYNGNPPLYAITKKGLNKLMRAAGIKMISSRSVLPSVCQKCSETNRAIGQPVSCGSCGNKDVRYEVKISVPQLTGENTEIVAHKEICIADVAPGMSQKQLAEFMKFRNEICETKAINRALRAAMQIKGAYELSEFQKPFVVAYLVPNLDNPDVRAEALKSMFKASADIYGVTPTTSEVAPAIEGASIAEPAALPGSELPPEPEYEPDDDPGPVEPAYYTQEPTYEPPQAAEPTQDSWLRCADCGARITEKVRYYSTQRYFRALCMNCQKKAGGAQR